MKILFSCVLISVLLGVSTALKKCLRPPAVHIAENFLTAGLFTIVAHSVCDNCEEGDEAFQYPTSKNATGSYCWHYTGKRNETEFKCNIECTYNTISEQICSKVSSQEKNTPALKGSTIITKTDNLTYFVAAVCRFGRENFWYIASHISSEMSERTKAELIAHVGKLGFLTEDHRTDEIQFVNLEVDKGKCNA